MIHGGTHFKDLSKEGGETGSKKAMTLREGLLAPSSEKGYKDSKNHKDIISLQCKGLTVIILDFDSSR